MICNIEQSNRNMILSIQKDLILILEERGGIGIFTSWKELLTMSEKVSSRVGESIIPGARK